MNQLDIVKHTSNSLAEFNKDFLLNWRTRKFDAIPLTMETMLKEAIVLLEPYGFKYEGYRILSPEEMLSYMSSRMKGTDSSSFFEVHVNSLYMAEFRFSFEGKIISSFAYIPFLRNHCIHYGGVDYYPDLPISEKCIHVSKKGLLTVKVARAPLMFWRSIEHPMFEEGGHKIFKEVIVTARIHLGKKDVKRSNDTPLILYFLVYGFEDTLDRLNIRRDEVQFVDRYDPHDKDHAYFEVKVYNRTDHVNTLYLKVLQESMKDVEIRRFVGGLLYSLDTFKKPYTVADIYDKEATFWAMVLGSRVYVNKALIDQDKVVIDHAREHCMINNTLLDGATKNAFNSIGIPMRDFDEFLLTVYNKIHEWSVSYNPANLYDKRINYNAIFGGFNEKLFKDIYKILRDIKKNKKKMSDKHTQSFLYLRANKPTWFNVGGMFMNNPTVYNSFVGLTLMHRFLSASTSESSEGRKGSKHVQKDLLLAHGSQLTVTSINTVPSSSPIISGGINPFISADDDGNIIVDPDLVKLTNNCFRIEHVI